MVQRQVLYLGEINDSQQQIGVVRSKSLMKGRSATPSWPCFLPIVRPNTRRRHGVQVRLDAMECIRPRQWGAFWLACQLYEQLGLDRFWAERLPPYAKVRAGSTSCRRWCVIGLSIRAASGACTGNHSEQSAMADLLGGDFALAEKNALYRCLDKLFPAQRGAVLASAPALAGFVRGAVRCVAVRLDEHLFQSAPTGDEADKRRHGYSRDKRSDSVQVVIALIVTPDGFPLGYGCWRGTPPTRPHCAACCARSKPNTARPTASG